MKTNKITSALLGIATGDALGVPYEFKSRAEMLRNPAKDMVGYGTHLQPLGTWSDDSSLTFCLADALTKGYDLKEIAIRFIAWKNQNLWTARGVVFDIGITTMKAIARLEKIITSKKYQELQELKYGGDEYDNGNGSLMRIMPLLFYIKDKSIKAQFEIVWDVSALTHRHIRAAMSCMIYLKFSEHLLLGLQKDDAYEKMRKDIEVLWDEIAFSQAERLHFERVIQNDIRLVNRDALKSGGYVIEVLESSMWCFLHESDYEKTVLSIINLGHDTDTAAAIAGGLAGLYYGSENIPAYWLASLARLEDIVELGNELNEKMGT